MTLPNFKEPYQDKADWEYSELLPGSLEEEIDMTTRDDIGHEIERLFEQNKKEREFLFSLLQTSHERRFR
jgi:hypothetical protein